MGLLFFLTTRVAWSFVEQKGRSIWKLVVASTQDWYTFWRQWHYDIPIQNIDLNPQWSHIGIFYVWNIQIFPLSIVDRWCSMDIFMLTCLKSTTRRRHLGVKSKQVSSVWFIGRRVAGVKHWESMILAKFCCIVQKCAQKSAQQPATLAKKR